MNNGNQSKALELGTADSQVILYKNQEDFAKALREGIGTGEENPFTDELLEEEQ